MQFFTWCKMNGNVGERGCYMFLALTRWMPSSIQNEFRKLIEAKGRVGKSYAMLKKTKQRKLKDFPVLFGARGRHERTCCRSWKIASNLDGTVCLLRNVRFFLISHISLSHFASCHHFIYLHKTYLLFSMRTLQTHRTHSLTHTHTHTNSGCCRSFYFD